LVTPDFTYDTERGSTMRKRTLATWLATVGLLTATGVKTAQAAGPCPTSGNITTDCDATGVSVVIDDLSFGSQIVTCPAGCTVSATAAAQKFYSSHDAGLYDFLIICPVFNTNDGARNFLVDPGDGVIRPDLTEHSVTGLGPGMPNMHLRSGYGASGHLQSYIQLPNCMNFPADDNARLPAADPNGYHSAMSMLAEQMGHRWGAYLNIPGGNPGALITSSKNWQFYTNSASTCPSAAPAGTLCASSLWGNNWTGSGTFTTNSRTDGFSPLDQYLMGLRDAAAVLPFSYITGASGPASSSAPHRAGSPAITVTGGASNTVTINDVIAQNGARTPIAAESPKTFNQAVILLAQGGAGNAPTQAMVARIEQLRQSWVRYFSETTDHNGEVDTRVKKRAVDVVFLLDLSGSFTDDLPVLKAQFQSLLNDMVATTSPGSQFGIASFVDFPFPPYGDLTFGDYTYRVDQALTNNTAQVNTVLQGLSTHSGEDLPQNQYEALYQVITGAGVDLNNDGLFTGTGEVPPSNIGHIDPTVPLFILLFTDATFHNPDTEAAYPTVAGHPFVHGRNAVLSVLQPPSPFTTSAAFVPTPKNYVFGMVPGLGLPPPEGILEIPELTELATLTGANVFPLSHDSAGVVAAVKQAVDDTVVPVLKTPKTLQKLAVRAATVHWSHNHDCEKGNDPSSLALLQGTVDLPDGTGFASMGLHSQVSLAAANLSLVTDEVDFASAQTRIGTLWHYGDTSKNVGVNEYDILWTSPTHGEYLILAQFDSATRNLNGNIRPASLTSFVSLGTGSDALSGDATVQGTQWKTLTKRHWQSKILLPLTAAAAAQVEEEGKMLTIGFDPEASEAAESNGCTVSGRRTDAGGGARGIWAGIALLAATAVVRRRKRA
jgi:hypothetical protein